MVTYKNTNLQFRRKSKKFYSYLLLKIKKYPCKKLLGEKMAHLIMFICNHCPYVKAIIKDIVQDCKIFYKDLGIKSAVYHVK